ncbi:acetylglutamate kinase [Haloarcula sp. CBA1130]|uniref:isopentenyl phosphate kinase n=1 Tax=unclassified Haloarcula TaxID=2624677 RepID=UPI0012479AFD|nr:MULTISPECIES: isopentenyl phosphate kinase [unclassified Haloarcula]KAA9398668.1 acetylglutamate kinase [Haloarcula sp. CBA1129]KAA9403185.1 acetylglutamate kinase [Haloarcula sp. CBA1130]
MTVVLKLGGSVITEKDEPETVDQAALSAAVSAIVESAVGEDIVIVHGGGSYGHHYAAEYGVSTTEGTHDVDGVQAIHGAMCRLNTAVVDALTEQGVPAVPIHPFSAATRDADGDLSLPTAQITTLLEEGFVPVLHGDLVAHAGAGATVLSGDELIVELAPAVDAERVGVCSTVPGVLDSDGTIIDRIETFEAVAPALGGSDATDVSGGMAGKVRALLALSAPALVFGPDALPAFLAGDSPGTTIAGDDAD